MSDLTASGAWRFAQAPDMPFLYHLAAAVEPRWWRITRGGASPSVVMSAIQQCDAVGVVLDADGEPVGAAALAEGSMVASTAVLDLVALPNDAARATVAAVAPDIVRAGLQGGALRALYHQCFDDDPDLLGTTRPLWVEEVRFPDYALVDGHWRDRSLLTLTAAAHEAWTAASAPDEVEP